MQVDDIKSLEKAGVDPKEVAKLLRMNCFEVDVQESYRLKQCTW